MAVHALVADCQQYAQLLKAVADGRVKTLQDAAEHWTVSQVGNYLEPGALSTVVRLDLVDEFIRRLKDSLRHLNEFVECDDEVHREKLASLLRFYATQIPEEADGITRAPPEEVPPRWDGQLPQMHVRTPEELLAYAQARRINGPVEECDQLLNNIHEWMIWKELEWQGTDDIDVALERLRKAAIISARKSAIAAWKSIYVSQPGSSIVTARVSVGLKQFAASVAEWQVQVADNVVLFCSLAAKAGIEIPTADDPYVDENERLAIELLTAGRRGASEALGFLRSLPPNKQPPNATWFLSAFFRDELYGHLLFPERRAKQAGPRTCLACGNSNDQWREGRGVCRSCQSDEGKLGSIFTVSLTGGEVDVTRVPHWRKIRDLARNRFGEGYRTDKDIFDRVWDWLANAHAERAEELAGRWPANSGDGPDSWALRVPLSTVVALLQIELCNFRDHQTTTEKVPSGPSAKSEKLSMRWRDAAERLEQLRVQGERYTTRADLAMKIGCSPSTIQRAFNEHSNLQAWERTKPVKTSPAAVELSEVVVGAAPQAREPEPGTVPVSGEEDVILARLLEEAPSAQREELQRTLDAMPADQRLKLAAAYQNADDLSEKSPKRRL